MSPSFVIIIIIRQKSMNNDQISGTMPIGSDSTQTHTTL